ncbi:hypothetical protein BC936DRAFT_138956 [Jimgerdemannia flammicorona]|uniref:Uncharacterized protein n=1 Tax=Jimgerdemannia flammicorona TaxID=994334 RepID=A0A433BCG9_9FUNG|nr:hypothetical protein BC936DRAFT_138956 [Jimgerdemannia flammicorona]
MIRRPLLHILDGGGASEKERLFRLSQNVDNDAIFVEKKKQPRRSPTRMARARAPAPAPSAIPAKAPVKTDIMAIDKDEDEDEDKIKPSVPVPSTCAFSSLVQSDRTVGKSSSPSPRKSVGRASTAVPKPMTRHFLDLDSEEEEELIRLLSKMPTSPSGKGKQAADLTLPEERSPPNPYVTTVLPNDEPGIGASSLRPSPIGVAPTGIPTREPPIEGVLPPFLPILPTPRLHPMPVPSAPPAQWTCKSCTVIHMVEPGLSDTECDLCGAFRFSS